MATKSLRYVDDQGRIILPSHIRKALNIGKGHTVTLDLDDDGSVRIRAVKERCCICGKGVQNKHCSEVTVGSDKKFVCFDCAQAVSRAMMK